MILGISLLALWLEIMLKDMFGIEQRWILIEFIKLLIILNESLVLMIFLKHFEQKSTTTNIPDQPLFLLEDSLERLLMQNSRNINNGTVYSTQGKVKEPDKSINFRSHQWGSLLPVY